MESKERCTECASTRLQINKERGEITCLDCGAVLEERLIDFGKEGFDGEDSEKSSRGVGAPGSATHADGLRTEIGNKEDLQILKGRNKYKFIRLKQWQFRTASGLERNLRQALSELKRICGYLKLPGVVEEEGARIYRLAVQKGLVRGRSYESVVAGVTYAACRIYNIPRTLDELETASGVMKKDIGRTYRVVARELAMHVQPSNPADYVPRFAALLRLHAMTQSKAVEILEEARRVDIVSGRGPAGTAAAALYVSSLINNEKRTQREVADVAGVTEVTIRNRYKELINKLHLLPRIERARKKD